MVTPVAEALMRITGRERLGESGIPDHERRARRRRRRPDLVRWTPPSGQIMSIRVIPADQKMLSA
jgi:hypothetical protein